MKALVVTKKNQAKRFLVEIQTDSLARELASLIARKRYVQAVKLILANGRIEKEVAESDVKDVKADILIEESGAI